MFLYDFHTPLPPYFQSQGESLNWLANAWGLKQQKDSASLLRILEKVACSEEEISKRYYYLPEFNPGSDHGEILNQPKGNGHLLRSQFFAKATDEVFRNA